MISPFLPLPKLHDACTLSIYSELLSIQKYKEYLIFSFIACPVLLLDWSLFELYEGVAMHMLVVTIFRDMVSE